VILDSEGIAIGCANEWLVARHPLPRLPEVIAYDLDVGRSHGRGSATEQD
jgi:hypothetical protein